MEEKVKQQKKHNKLIKQRMNTQTEKLINQKKT